MRMRGGGHESRTTGPLTDAALLVLYCPVRRVGPGRRAHSTVQLYSCTQSTNSYVSPCGRYKNCTVLTEAAGTCVTAGSAVNGTSASGCSCRRRGEIISIALCQY